KTPVETTIVPLESSSISEHQESSSSFTMKRSMFIQSSTSQVTSSSSVTTEKSEPTVQVHSYSSQSEEKIEQIGDKPPLQVQSQKTQEFHQQNQEKPVIHQQTIIKVLNGVANHQETVKSTSSTPVASPKPTRKSVAPRFVTPLNGKIVDQGADVVLDGILDGYPQPTVTWYKNGQELIPKDGSVIITWELNHARLELRNVGVKDAGRYTCKAVNDVGSASSTADVVVKKTIFPPVFGRRLQAQIAKVGDRVSMDVEVTGTPDPVVTWYKNDEQILGAVPGGPFRTKIQGNSYSLIIEKADTSYSGKYTVKAVNSGGEAQCIADFIVVEPEPLKEVRTEPDLQMTTHVVFKDVREEKVQQREHHHQTSSSKITTEQIHLEPLQPETKKPSTTDTGTSPISTSPLRISPSIGKPITTESTIVTESMTTEKHMSIKMERTPSPAFQRPSEETHAPKEVVQIPVHIEKRPEPAPAPKKPEPTPVHKEPERSPVHKIPEPIPAPKEPEPKEVEIPVVIEERKFKKEETVEIKDTKITEEQQKVPVEEEQVKRNEVQNEDTGVESSSISKKSAFDFFVSKLSEKEDVFPKERTREQESIALKTSVKQNVSQFEEMHIKESEQPQPHAPVQAEIHTIPIVHEKRKVEEKTIQPKVPARESPSFFKKEEHSSFIQSEFHRDSPDSQKWESSQVKFNTFPLDTSTMSQFHSEHSSSMRIEKHMSQHVMQHSTSSLEGFDLQPEPPPEIGYIPKTEVPQKLRLDMSSRVKKLEESHRVLSPVEIPSGAVKIFPTPIRSETPTSEKSEPQSKVEPEYQPKPISEEQKVVTSQKKMEIEEELIKKEVIEEVSVEKKVHLPGTGDWTYQHPSPTVKKPLLEEHAPVTPRPWSPAPPPEPLWRPLTPVEKPKEQPPPPKVQPSPPSKVQPPWVSDSVEKPYRPQTPTTKTDKPLRPTSPRPSAEGVAMEKLWASRRTPEPEVVGLPVAPIQRPVSPKPLPVESTEKFVSSSITKTSFEEKSISTDIRRAASPRPSAEGVAMEKLWTPHKPAEPEPVITRPVSTGPQSFVKAMSPKPSVDGLAMDKIWAHKHPDSALKKAWPPPQAVEEKPVIPWAVKGSIDKTWPPADTVKQEVETKEIKVIQQEETKRIHVELAAPKEQPPPPKVQPPPPKVQPPPPQVQPPPPKVQLPPPQVQPPPPQVQPPPPKVQPPPPQVQPPPEVQPPPPQVQSQPPPPQVQSQPPKVQPPPPKVQPQPPPPKVQPPPPKVQPPAPMVEPLLSEVKMTDYRKEKEEIRSSSLYVQPTPVPPPANVQHYVAEARVVHSSSLMESQIQSTTTTTEHIEMKSEHLEDSKTYSSSMPMPKEPSPPVVEEKGLRPSEARKAWPPGPKEEFEFKAPAVLKGAPPKREIVYRPEPLPVQELVLDDFLEPGPPPEIGFAPAPPVERRQSFVEAIEQDLQKDLEKEPSRHLVGAVRTIPPPPPKEKSEPPPLPPKEKAIPPPLPPKEKVPEVKSAPKKETKKPVTKEKPFERFPDLEPFPFKPEEPKPKPAKCPPPPTPSKFIKGDFGSDYESDIDSVHISAKWRPYESDTEEVLSYRRVIPPTLKQPRRPKSTEPDPLPPSKFDQPPQFVGPPRPTVGKVQISKKESKEIKTEVTKVTSKIETKTEKVKKHHHHHESKKKHSPPALKPGSPPIFVEPATAPAHEEQKKSEPVTSPKAKPDSPKMKTKTTQSEFPESGYMADTDEPRNLRQQTTHKYSHFKHEESSKTTVQQTTVVSDKISQQSSQVVQKIEKPIPIKPHPSPKFHHKHSDHKSEKKVVVSSTAAPSKPKKEISTSTTLKDVTQSTTHMYKEERSSTLEPFPFKVEPAQPTVKRVVGPPPPSPSKFVKGEFRESDYESDYDSRIPAKWRPYDSDADEPTYKPVRPVLTPSGSRIHSRASVEMRTPTPPTEFDNPPQFGGPPRPKFEPIEKPAPPVKLDDLNRVPERPQKVFKPTPVIPRAPSPVEVIVATPAVKEPDVVLQPGTPPEMGYAPPPPRVTKFPNATQMETSKVMKFAESTEHSHRVVSVQQTTRVIKFGDQEKKTEPEPKLEQFPFKPEPERPQRRSGPPPTTPKKFIPAEFRESDYESDYESMRIKPKWTPGNSDTDEPRYRKVKPPPVTRSASVPGKPSGRVPTPMEFDTEPVAMPSPVVVSVEPKTKKTTMTTTLEVESEQKRLKRVEEMRRRFSEGTTTSTPQVQKTIATKRQMSASDAQQTIIQPGEPPEFGFVPASASYVASKHMSEMTNTFKSKAKQFVDDIITDVKTVKENGHVEKGKVPPVTDENDPQAYREESRVAEYGTKHIDPDTGLIYFKYDFGYEFGVVLPGEGKKQGVGDKKTKKPQVEKKRNDDIEVPVIHEKSGSDKKKVPDSQPSTVPQFRPKKFTHSKAVKWEPMSESEMSEAEGDLTLQHKKRYSLPQPATATFQKAPHILIPPSSRWDQASPSPMSLSPSLPSLSPRYVGQGPHSITPGVDSTVSPGGSWQGLSPNRGPRGQGRGSTPTPPSTPSTPGSTHGSVGNLTQPRKPPTFITPLRDIAVVSGQTARFECIVQAEPPPNILWSKNGRIIENSQNYQIQYRNGVCRLTIPQAFPAILGVQFKVCHGSLYAVTWLVDEPREFNLPTLPQRCITYLPEKLPTKYGVHSEEYLPIRTIFTVSSSLLSKNLKVRIYKTVILPVLLYGCETWTLTLREEHRLRVFENKVLRKIFGAKRNEVTEEWRKLHNTELHTLYSSPDIIRNLKSRRLRWAGHVARMGESRNAYRVLVGRPEGKRPLGRPRRRWEDNIKMDLREVDCDDRDWINLAQDRDRWRAYVRAAMNLRVP
ncbi:hypothetical protein ANN_21796, partial [Periplaneta americana]